MPDNEPGRVIAPNQTSPETNWQFKPDPANNTVQSAVDTMPPNSEPEPQQAKSNTKNDTGVSWTASEFISHDKSTGWYALLGLFAIALAALVYFFSHGDKVPTVVVIIVAITFGVMASRKPRELDYSVDERGVQVGDKLYSYAGFRSFAVVQEEAVESIWLMPLKRFTPPLTIYFDPDDGQKIVDVLGSYLPIENRQLDMVDRLMHRIRF